jgi:nitronate monooxygenase
VITDLFDIDLPIIQAPMAGVGTVELVAAVSEAGGLGSLGAAAMRPDELREAIRSIRELTDRPFAVNLFAYPAEPEPAEEARAAMREFLAPHREALGVEQAELPGPESYLELLSNQLAVVAEERVPVFSFTIGIPDLDAIREADAVTLGTATTVDEAIALQEAGVDIVVAQGAEAGGHRGSFLEPGEESLVGLFALVPQVADAIDLPVVAAGAIADGRGVAAALALGAQGVQVGTAFIPTDESGAAEAYRRRVLESAADETTVTGAWSGRAARAVKTSLIDELENSGLEIPPHPRQQMLTRPLHAADAERGDGRGEFMFLLSGQAGRLARTGPAGDVVRRLVAETQETLDGLD